MKKLTNDWNQARKEFNSKSNDKKRETKKVMNILIICQKNKLLLEISLSL